MCMFWVKQDQAFKQALLFLLFPTFFLCSYFSLLFFVFLLFPTFFLCSYFSLLFTENALLSQLFSPKMFELTKNCNFFSRLLEVCKNWINLILAVMLQMFMKYFYFSCNSFFGTFILVFPYHGDVVLLFRETCFLISSFSKSENTQNIPTIPTFHDLNSYIFKILSPTLSLFFHWRALESLQDLFFPHFDPCHAK